MGENVVSAPINTGGNSIVGNNNTINQFINGLEMLVQEYKDQLTKISTLLSEFKPKTALSLLQELENRIIDKNIDQKDTLKAKILYLKGLCKSEIQTFTKENSAMDFVNAYNLNKNDNSFRDRACFEYLNLAEDEKAKTLADEILKIEEFNISAWYVKCLLLENFSEIPNILPKTLKDNNDFSSSLIIKVIQSEGIRSYDDLKKYGLEYKFNINEFTEVTFANKIKWIVNINLLLDRFFIEFPIRYISGNTFITDRNPSIDNALNLLDKFISTLTTTELSDSLTVYEFHYHYLKYLIKNNDEDLKMIQIKYKNLQTTHWSYTLSICQVLNHKGRFEDSLEILNDYSKKTSEHANQYYLFKAIVLDALQKPEGVEEMFMGYLSLKQILDDTSVLHIFSTFFNIQKKYCDKELFQREHSEIMKMKYTSPDLKKLVDVTLKINFLEDRTEDVIQQLKEIESESLELSECKVFVARNFAELGLRSEAIKFLEGFVDRKKISDELRLYIQFLINQLYDKNDSERRYEELLELLKFWREKSEYVDEEFLRIEHNLYGSINDIDNLTTIDELLYQYFPNEEEYIYHYILALEKKKKFDKIAEIITDIESFEDEIFGVNICIVLLRNQINVTKAFTLLYGLAKNKNNINARRAYFTHTLVLEGFLKKFEEVRVNNWVVYNIDDTTHIIKITKQDGLQGKFIGRKVGDKFIETSKMSRVNKNIEIIEIYNNAMRLFREISEEAHNPLNELGFESLNFPKEKENLEEFLKNHLGARGSEEKKFRESQLNEYYNRRIGFSEITRSVFDDDFIDAYNYLTNNKGHFTTIPNSLISNHIADEYGLDTSAILLMYYLEKEFQFQFIHKFKITYQTKEYVEKEILELKNSPASKLSMNITLEKVEKYIFPDDINDRKIVFLESVLEWINDNCVVDNIIEKLELYPKLQANEKDFNSDFMKNFVDVFYISTREKFRLISNDTFLYVHKNNNNIYNNQLNPEKYLKTYYSDKCDEVFYRQLLKWNYLGIDINLAVLKNEFFDLLAGKENYYSKAVENLQFSVCTNQQIIYTCSKFLKEVYLTISMTIENKNRYALDLFASNFNLKPTEIVNLYESILRKEFKLLGDYYDNVLIQFKLARKLYQN